MPMVDDLLPFLAGVALLIAYLVFSALAIKTPALALAGFGNALLSMEIGR